MYESLNIQRYLSLHKTHFLFQFQAEVSSVNFKSITDLKVEKLFKARFFSNNNYKNMNKFIIALIAFVLIASSFAMKIRTDPVVRKYSLSQYNG